MHTIRILRPLAALLGLLVAAGSQAQQDFSQVSIETIPVAEGIYMLMGAGGNIGVSVGDDGVVLIDDQFAPLAPKIQAAVARLTDRPITMVLNTHWHGDHAGGNEHLASAGALIIAHDNVRLRMSQSHYSAFFDTRTPPSPAAALPVVTFASTATLHVNGQTLRAEHVPPAHTDGDAIIWFEEANVVHMGDTFFNGLYPFIDFSTGGSVAGMIAAIDAALPRMDADTRVIPGHGPLSDKAGLQAFRDMLATVTGRIEAMMAAGRSLAEIQAARPTADYDDQLGGGFIEPDQWVALIHGGLQR